MNPVRGREGPQRASTSNGMKNLFTIFQKSLYGPEFYQGVALTSFKDAFRYYLKFTLLLAVFMTIAFAVILVPQGVRFIKEEAPALVKKYYPKGLVVTVTKGEASSNVVEPYIIPVEGVVKEVLQESKMDNILVIDTQNEFNKKTFESYKTFALLTKGEIVVQDDTGISIQNLSGLPNFVMSEEALLAWVEKVRTSLSIFIPASITLTFIVIMVGFVLYFIPLLLFALIPFFLAWVKKIPLTYGGAYKISMYAVMPGLVLKSILNISGFFFVPAYLSLLVFMLTIFINFRGKVQPSLFKDKK